MIKQVRNLVLVFIGVVLLGFLSMIISYSIPMSKIHDRIVQNTDPYFATYSLIPFDDGTVLDLYTDSIILGETATYNKSKSLIDNAIMVYGPTKGVNDFLEYASGNESTITSYERYWHGSLIVLRPLFYLFDYNSIKVLNLLLQLLLVFGIIKLMIKNGIEKYILPFIISLFLIHPATIGLSFQYSAMYNLLLLSILFMLKFKDKLLEKNRFMYFFLVIGMLTSFFDFLTYPAVIFGVPIVFYLLLEDKKSFKEKLLKILLYGVLWCIGYVGMWFSKWAITSIILQKDAISEALNIIFFRTSTEKFTRFDAIMKNIGIYKKRSYVTIFGLIFIYYLVRIIKNRKTLNKSILIKMIPFILVALIPFVWYFVISNHSYIHYWMTYRELVIFFFAGMCGCEILINKDRSKRNEKRK